MILKIYDAIMNDEERDMIEFFGGSGVSFKSVDEFIASIPEDDDTIDLRLNCYGGDCLTGWAIVDKLRATGKKITATIEGTAASMGSVILLAASERRAYQHAQLLIHRPYFGAYTLANEMRQADLERLAKQLADETARALDFMVERTGSDRETLEALMDQNKFISMEEAKDLGFIHEILMPASASAKGWSRPVAANISHKDMKDKSTLASAFQAIAEALGFSVQRPAAYVLTTQDGTELEIDKAEGEDPAVGDAASPDGEHLMPDGTTIVVVDGVITEIRDAQSNDEENTDTETENETENEELAAKEAEIASLKARIAELEGSQMSDDQKQVLAKVEKAGGAAWLDKTLKSGYVPAQRAKVNPAKKTSQISEDLAALKAKRGKKTNA